MFMHTSLSRYVWMFNTQCSSIYPVHAVVKGNGIRGDVMGIGCRGLHTCGRTRGAAVGDLCWSVRSLPEPQGCLNCLPTTVATVRIRFEFQKAV